MKTLRTSSTRNPDKLGRRIGLAVAAILLSGIAAPAQTFTTLKSFGTLSNVSGFNPHAPLMQGPDGTLYGTASAGEANVHGTVFRLQPDGSGFTVIKWFTNDVEGTTPNGGLALSGGTLYGTTSAGGASGSGTVFKVNTNGTGFAVLKDFSGIDGAQPYAPLMFSGSVLYGTTETGGTSGNGTVFKLNADGTGFSVLKDFSGSDGSGPYGIALSGSVLYGATFRGGSSGQGTIFQINSNGTGFAVLKHFVGADGTGPAALTLAGSVLYGATYYIGTGTSDNGGVFKINTDGTGFTVLKRFSDLPTGTNSDGAMPGPLTLSGSVLYGATAEGGNSANGTVFRLNTDGTDFTVLKHFSGNDSGGHFGLIFSGNSLYGALDFGGIQNNGTLFRMNTDGANYTVLKTFTYDPDGSEPSGLTAYGGDLYGTTLGGGSDRSGTLYKLSTDGADYTVLKHFSAASTEPFTGADTNLDGMYPDGGVTVSGNALYGSTSFGGSSGSGTLFKMNTDGTGFTLLKSFSLNIYSGTNSDGGSPRAQLTLSGDVLYGTNPWGGTSGLGTLFKINTDGTGFAVLKDFTFGDGGLNPVSCLVLSGAALYGTAATIFRLNTDGTGFAVLRGFDRTNDGALPADLTLSGSMVYAMTQAGGSYGQGTVFKMNTDGSRFTVLRHFTANDGAGSPAPLTLSGGKLYGTTYFGGSSDKGTVFRINTDGTGYAVLKHFTSSDGTPSRAGLISYGGALYGATTDGGILNRGTVFKLDLSIPLTIQPLDSAVVLTWADPAFALQAAPAADAAYTNISGATSPYTNATSGTRKFFRLIGN